MSLPLPDAQQNKNAWKDLNSYPQGNAGSYGKVTKQADVKTCMTVNPLPDVHNTHILYIIYIVSIKVRKYFEDNKNLSIH